MYSWKDRLRDWIAMRGPLTHIGLAIVCSLVIVAIILAAAMPGKGLVNTHTTDIGQLKTTMGVISDGLGTKVSLEALNATEQAIEARFEGQNTALNRIEGRLNNADTGLDAIWTQVGNITGYVRYLQDKLTNSPPEVSLQGTFGNYTLTAKSAHPGNFTANVHLIYSPAVGNAGNQSAALGYFYAGVNWTVNATIPQYVPVTTFDGTAWGVSQVWWNVGMFPLVAGNMTMLDVTCPGLNITWVPSFAYVEAYPVG